MRMCNFVSSPLSAATSAAEQLVQRRRSPEKRSFDSREDVDGDEAVRGEEVVLAALVGRRGGFCRFRRFSEE